MATIAIDQTDVRGPATPVAPAKPVFNSRIVLVAGGVVIGIMAIGGTAAAILSNVTLPKSLSGLAFLPKPDAPRRTEIRIGRLPDMPEIRDGVPAVIGTKAAPRIVETFPPAPAASGPKQVAVIPVPAAALAKAPLPNAFTSAAATQLASPMVQVGGPARVDTVALTSSVPPGPSRSLGEPSPSASLVAPALEREAPFAFKPVPKPEPVSTASVPAASVFVPLPPPAPARSLARTPEAKPEKPAKPAQVAARQTAQPVTPPPADAAPQAADDRMEVLGVKLPNGSDLKNAVSSIGEALNLPKAF
jgi:hypothetical protein